ncbi:conserved hypothetical protein [Leptospira interrogans serovar Manilae]|uniref:Uncharacterized protein n=1 Tax=Leptospira interrogans serovar Manilae TaxID=214675 RepID=A0AAQ1P433_LEPIR|nr:hypothetical protein [Leptospira interrogans]AKP28169.1 hypothetical protein LIMLP_19270 [Leptospira interrogans serovar Manilae]AKP31950.1 hypothetical protein LIMHP_19275 [Leptospira interrogans serovar Manilae]EMJ55994.1 hypothetical protein LEP1GSC013_0113 [Leptospira interrogans serovar Valbuzzi str. Duyster]ENO70513.1 hypothetical protein LEP1GSC012_4276 [Leptospira interrogans serovar Valbuzzi str. Valbuzzi]EYU63980.1 hypothetical protein CI00_10840 [Leptospira interrogans serovar Ma
MASKVKRSSFQKLLNAMKKMSLEVNDYEICRRLETIMMTSKEDLSQVVVKSLLDNPLDFDPKTLPEPYGQYIRHFVYMVKRNKKQGIDTNFDSPINNLKPPEKQTQITEILKMPSKKERSKKAPKR